MEAFRVISSNQQHSFTEGRRNKAAGDRVEFKVDIDSGETYTLKTVANGGSETEWDSENRQGIPQIYYLPSRRYFDPYFGKGVSARESYTRSGELPRTRGQSINNFSGRLFNIGENRNAFDAVLAKVTGKAIDWTIDQNDGGQYYLKVSAGEQHHSSDGLGEGLVSLMFIVDALYDSQPEQMIVIDEPELSLHPAYQEKVAALLIEYSADRQIVYSTHSPEFVNFDAVISGAHVSRVLKDDHGACRIFQLQPETVASLAGFRNNLNNPHILGLDARKVFFLQDNVVLVEGQEDVIYYERISRQIEQKIDGSFYGWGVGGATNMRIISAVLRDLGFSKIVGILDNNVAALVHDLSAEFPDYRFLAIPADDVRTKAARAGSQAMIGLLDENGNLREEYAAAVAEIVVEANNYFE